MATRHASSRVAQRYIERLHEVQTENKRHLSPAQSYQAEEPWWSPSNCLFWTISLYKAERDQRIVTREQEVGGSLWTAEWLGIDRSKSA